MERTKWNNFILGIFLGFLLPCLSLVGYWAWSFRYMNFPTQFFAFLLLGKVLSAVLSLCLLPSLGMFYIFVNKEFYKTTRGIILSTIIIGGLIVWLKTYVEHSWSI